jgi:hypothetical protein
MGTAMYLQNTADAGTPPSTLRDENAADSVPARPDLALRIGVLLLVASGAILGMINLLVMIHLVAMALGG